VDHAGVAYRDDFDCNDFECGGVEVSGVGFAFVAEDVVDSELGRASRGLVCNKKSRMAPIGSPLSRRTAGASPMLRLPAGEGRLEAAWRVRVPSSDGSVVSVVAGDTGSGSPCSARVSDRSMKTSPRHLWGTLLRGLCGDRSVRLINKAVGSFTD